MLGLMEFLRPKVEPVVLDLMVKNGSDFAKNNGLAELNVEMVQKLSNLMYHGPLLFTATELGTINGKAAANIVEDIIDNSNYDEPTLASVGISTLLSAGTYVASGGGLFGASLSHFIGRSAEPIVRKFQFELDRQAYNNCDETLERDSLASLEKYGYGATGF